jgi:hypothetical protein
MGKKFITLQRLSKKYKLFAEDIKNVFQRTGRKIPSLPRYEKTEKVYDDDT